MACFQCQVDRTKFIITNDRDTEQPISGVINFPANSLRVGTYAMGAVVCTSDPAAIGTHYIALRAYVGGTLVLESPTTLDNAPGQQSEGVAIQCIEVLAGVAHLIVVPGFGVCAGSPGFGFPSGTNAIDPFPFADTNGKCGELFWPVANPLPFNFAAIFASADNDGTTLTGWYSEQWYINPA